MIFKRDFAEAVMARQKTVTRRRMSDNPRSPWYRFGCKFKVGQVFAVQPGRGEKGIGYAKVLGVSRVRLGNITPLGAEREGCADVRDFQRRWISLHRDWTPDEQVFRIAFTRVEGPDG